MTSHKYSIVPIVRDGNCLFRAVSYCIYGSENLYVEIRKRVVRNIISQWDFFKEFVIGDLSYSKCIQSSSDYESVMKTDGEYAGHVELHSVGELYPSHLFKIHKETEEVISYGNGSIVHHLLYSGPIDNGHYDVIKILPSYTDSEKSKQRRILIGKEKASVSKEIYKNERNEMDTAKAEDKLDEIEYTHRLHFSDKFRRKGKGILNGKREVSVKRTFRKNIRNNITKIKVAKIPLDKDEICRINSSQNCRRGRRKATLTGRREGLVKKSLNRNIQG